MITAAGSVSHRLPCSWTSNTRGDGDHELVGHRVEESPERRALFQASGQVTVQPVSGGGEGEDRG